MGKCRKGFYFCGNFYDVSRTKNKKQHFGAKSLWPFGVVKTWPELKGCWWPPTRSRLESPGWREVFAGFTHAAQLVSKIILGERSRRLEKTALRLKVIEKPLVFGVFFLLLFFPFVCPVYMWLCRGLLGSNICRFSFVVEICIFEGFFVAAFFRCVSLWKGFRSR